MSRLLALCFWFGLIGGCTSNRSKDRLGELFPKQAREIGGGSGFSASPLGFTAGPIRKNASPVELARAALSDRGGLRLQLPRRGEDSISIGLPDGFAFQVRELDARGEGQLDGTSLRY